MQVGLNICSGIQRVRSSWSVGRMTSGCNSPVTPPQHTSSASSSIMQRAFANKNRHASSAAAAGILPLITPVVAQDSDTFWSPNLSPETKMACQEALGQLTGKVSRPDVIDREFMSLATSRSDKVDLIRRLKVAQLRVNQQKNRYMDVLPFDDTRVVLQGSSDYINASLIEDSDGSLPKFIATQGPLKSTADDFWEMVMQYRCSAIIMLTSFFDGNLNKCAPYFPTAVGQHQVFGRLKVTNKCLNLSRYSIAKRVFEVQSLEQGVEPPLNVLHLEYLEWPDHGVPASTRPIRELFRCMSSLPVETGPLVVHCSAGIGRSGTYITIDYSLRKILKRDQSGVNIENTVRNLRHQRMGMVQTKAQYHFCYASIAEELEEMI